MFEDNTIESIAPRGKRRNVDSESLAKPCERSLWVTLKFKSTLNQLAPPAPLSRFAPLNVLEEPMPPNDNNDSEDTIYFPYPADNDLEQMSEVKKKVTKTANVKKGRAKKTKNLFEVPKNAKAPAGKVPSVDRNCLTIEPSKMHTPAVGFDKVETVDDEDVIWLCTKRVPDKPNTPIQDASDCAKDTQKAAPIIKPHAPSPFEYFTAPIGNSIPSASIPIGAAKMAASSARQSDPKSPPPQKIRDNYQGDEFLKEIFDFTVAQSVDQSHEVPYSEDVRSAMLHEYRKVGRMMRKIYRKGRIQRLTHNLEPIYFQYQLRLINISLQYYSIFTEDERVEAVLNRTL